MLIWSLRPSLWRLTYSFTNTYTITISPIFGVHFFGWFPFSVIESGYLIIKYRLGHFFNLFNFRIELVLKNMHFFSCLKSLLMARLKLNNTGQPSVDHHGPFGVSSGRILKYWRFEFFVVKNFSRKRHHRVFTWQFCTFLTATQMERSQSNIVFFNRDKILV